jgi:hypothetical protein
MLARRSGLIPSRLNRCGCELCSSSRLVLNIMAYTVVRIMHCSTDEQWCRRAG